MPRRLAIIALFLLVGCKPRQVKVAEKIVPHCTFSAATPIDGGMYVNMRCTAGTTVELNNDPQNGWIRWKVK